MTALTSAEKKGEMWSLLSGGDGSALVGRARWGGCRGLGHSTVGLGVILEPTAGQYHRL